MYSTSQKTNVLGHRIENPEYVINVLLFITCD